ncbi:U2 snRNP complex subunit CUS1 LALA0_S05e02410g [Lachancea lanzarotensis]|uniref:LALA0S05e02410g1_1 n=1 Tax=Lachancea lanzarotensis TaxID=1245769 RepID=A0A0C7MQU8_9SACH|nr:uncharacterized protein LALA0_S05e02410g [Lachancea lanzarotensis]CEP62298.1 LALA0S05e02410g1_1 [Lachancea lanzarotensis]
MAASNKTKRKQKSKKSSNTAKNGDSRRELLEFVGQLKAKRNLNNTVANQPAILEAVHNDSAADPEHFKSVFAKFQPPKVIEDHDIESTTPIGIRTLEVLEADEPEEKSLVDTGDTSQPSQQAPQLSNRKQRRLAKISLAELKSKVLYPELVQWYDCDAANPVLLAQIKSSKNVVQVPNHWQLKREYLSGRSVTAKKPFELPSIIRQTNIEEMRNTLPTQGATEEQSLKENARARIRPKLGSLDLDYRKLHDAFFKIGRTWKPDYMLRYGDMYYENRNLQEESGWKQMEKNLRPGKLSKELRIAMGLPEGKLPPWCAKFNELGMPPSYPDYKVAGVNWDITNLHDNVYGVLGAEQKIHSDPPLFGQMIQLDDEIESSEETGASSAHNPSPNGKNDKDATELERSAEKDKRIEDEVRARTMGELLKRRNQEKLSQEGQEKPRKLYSVIHQKDTAAESELTGTSIAYDLDKSREDQAPSQAGAVEKIPVQSHKSEQGSTKQEESKTFKF